MTSVPNRSRRALLVIDMQRAVVAEAHNREGVIANIGRLNTDLEPIATTAEVDFGPAE